jgi:hypothetical protein
MPVEAARKASCFGLCLLSGVSFPEGVGAQLPSAGDVKIYTCVDPSGRRLSSDRPIPECLGQEQRLLNRDGSVRAVQPPYQSSEDLERQQAAIRAQRQEQVMREEALRRDRSLLVRYPDPASHDLARRRALDPVHRLIEASKSRLAELEAEAAALTAERASMGFRPVSEDLRSRTNVNEGAMEAQRNILRNQEIEQTRVTQQFDAERQRLQVLWSPPLAVGSSAASAAGASGNRKR